MDIKGILILTLQLQIDLLLFYPKGNLLSLVPNWVNVISVANNKFLKKLSEAEIESLLKTVIERLTSLKKWNSDSLQMALNELLTETGRKPAELFSLVRIAISFAPFSPALNLTLEVLGKGISLARLNAVARSI